MGNLSAEARRKKMRRLGKVGGIAAAAVFVLGGIVFTIAGGSDSGSGGDRYHVWGTRDATELAHANADAFVYLDATADASETGDASVTADASP